MFKEKFEKVKKFYKENQEIIIGGAAIVGGTVLCISLVKSFKDTLTTLAATNDISAEELEEISKKFVHNSPDIVDMQRDWIDRGGADTYKYVEEIAGLLDAQMIDGEEYIIEKTEEWGIVVSHMINGTGVYLTKE